MEHEIKVKADDRWMDDSEVSHCLSCKAEFSFLLRKVRVVNSQCRNFRRPGGQCAHREILVQALGEVLALSVLASWCVFGENSRLDPNIEKQILRFFTK